MAVCRTNISKLGQVCLSMSSSLETIQASLSIDQAGPYTALHMPKVENFQQWPWFLNERLFCSFFMTFSKNYETMDQHLLKRLH